MGGLRVEPVMTELASALIRHSSEGAAHSLGLAELTGPVRKKVLTTPRSYKVFGCRLLTDGAARMGGRRRKTSKGGNRGKGDEGGWSRTMGI
jgi:hypothetical protein